MTEQRKIVRVEKDKWSRSSKQSLAYDFAKRTYKDRHFKCRRCSAAAVFTAEQQKHTFEVRKAYIWQGRSLCADCFAQEQHIERQLLVYASKWRNNKAHLAKDQGFLREWLCLLEAHVKFGHVPDSAAIAMVRSKLAEAAQQKGQRDCRGVPCDDPVVPARQRVT